MHIEFKKSGQIIRQKKSKARVGYHIHNRGYMH